MGMWELVVVFIVGLVVLGPERLPVAIRTVSRWVKTAKAMANSVKAEVSEELRVHELHENLKKAEQQGRNLKNYMEFVFLSYNKRRNQSPIAIKKVKRQHQIANKQMTQSEHSTLFFSCN